VYRSENSTVYENLYGGGLFNSGTATLKNTVLARNTDEVFRRPGQPPRCNGFTSLGSTT
jgi:hypothetical protein